MSEAVYPQSTRELAQTRRALAPEAEAAFRAFSQKVFEEGALSSKVKELIAVAVAHVTQCPYCIRGHTKAALRKGGDARGDHGGNLGGVRDARRRGLRTFRACHRGDGQGSGEGEMSLVGRPRIGDDQDRR